MNSTHLLDIDKLTGDEYIAGGEEILSPSFFIEHASTNFEKQYSQLEFASEYGKNLCTEYGPMTVLSMTIGRELTLDERLELVKERVAQGDFDIGNGGFTSVGVDVTRRWYNKKFQNDPITTLLVNNDSLLEKLTQKNIPLVTSIRANREFTQDQKDVVMDKLDYWNYTSPRYGHCRTLKQLKVFDNYLNSYIYKNLSDLELCRDKAFESRNCYMFVKESLLSEKGKTYLKYMRKKYWNGERPTAFITRYEASRIALKMNPVLKEKDVWNGKDGQKEATKYEVSVMLNKANMHIPLYLGLDRNHPVERGVVIETIASHPEL